MSNRISVIQSNDVFGAIFLKNFSDVSDNGDFRCVPKKCDTNFVFGDITDLTVRPEEAENGGSGQTGQLECHAGYFLKRRDGRAASSEDGGRTLSGVTCKYKPGEVDPFWVSGPNDEEVLCRADCSHNDDCTDVCWTKCRRNM